MVKAAIGRPKHIFRGRPKDYKDISFIEDFAKVISERFSSCNYSRNVDAIKCMLDFIVTESKSQDVFAIELPEIGIISLNYAMSVVKLKKTFRPKMKEFWESRVSHLKYFKAEFNSKANHFQRSPLTYYTQQLPKDYFASNYIKRKKDLQNIYAVIEELQNESYKKEITY